MKLRNVMKSSLCCVLTVLVLSSVFMTLPISAENSNQEVNMTDDSYSSDFQSDRSYTSLQSVSFDNVHYYKDWKDLPIHKTDEFYNLYFKLGTNAYKPNNAPSSPLYPDEYEKDSVGEYVYGNCTWYCWSRASEMLIRNGESGLPKKSPAPSSWISLFGKTYGYRYSTSANAQPESNSIAVYQGHVRYIDYVDGDLLIYSESGYRDTLSNDKWNGGVPTWLCYEVGTATKNSDGTWSGKGDWNYTFTVGKGSGSAKLLGYIYLDVPAVSLEDDNSDDNGWSEIKTSYTKPTESENLKIVKTETKYNYYHYCCNYYDGTNNVDSISYGSGSHHYHTVTSTSEYTATNIGDKGGQILYKGKKCSCGFQVWAKSETFKETIYYYQVKEHTHSYTAVVTAPTCTDNGYTTYTCTYCGDSYKDNETDKTGHFQIIIPSIYPTCTDWGKTEGAKCSVCGKSIADQISIPPFGHTEHILPEIEATCTEKGLTAGVYCEMCGEMLIKRNELPPKGHVAVIDSAVPPTCTTSGLTEGEHCSVCNEVIVAQAQILPTDHTPGQWIITEEPTQEATGKKQQSCTFCGKLLCEEIIPAIPKETETETEPITEPIIETETLTETETVSDTETISVTETVTETERETILTTEAETEVETQMPLVIGCSSSVLSVGFLIPLIFVCISIIHVKDHMSKGRK
ncbi:MAG: hypothetical protein IJW70_07255 [Clostridia bacterium]|nr:hypothetical protein [Clostridia bacterium]